MIFPSVLYFSIPLFVPSLQSGLTCWRNIRLWMLEDESEAQRSQPFPGVAQMVCLVDLPWMGDEVQILLWREGSAQQRAQRAGPQQALPSERSACQTGVLTAQGSGPIQLLGLAIPVRNTNPCTSSRTRKPSEPQELL